jgi:hypothetical protein
MVLIRNSNMKRCGNGNQIELFDNFFDAFNDNISQTGILEAED